MWLTRMVLAPKRKLHCFRTWTDFGISQTAPVQSTLDHTRSRFESGRPASLRSGKTLMAKVHPGARDFNQISRRWFRTTWWPRFIVEVRIALESMVAGR